MNVGTGSITSTLELPKDQIHAVDCERISPITSNDCRAVSRKCYKAAETAASPPDKSLLTAMARTWIQLANQIDRLDRLPTRCCP